MELILDQAQLYLVGFHLVSLISFLFLFFWGDSSFLFGSFLFVLHENDYYHTYLKFLFKGGTRSKLRSLLAVITQSRRQQSTHNHVTEIIYPSRTAFLGLSLCSGSFKWQYPVSKKKNSFWILNRFISVGSISLAVCWYWMVFCFFIRWPCWSKEEAWQWIRLWVWHTCGITFGSFASWICL